MISSSKGHCCFPDVYDIKWDGEGNRIKDKARLVGKGYTQQLGIDYNETWAGVTRLESVRITAAIAAKLNLRLWQIDFVGAYLNSLTKEDIYMKQSEGFIEPGFEDYVCKSKRETETLCPPSSQPTPPPTSTTP